MIEIKSDSKNKEADLKLKGTLEDILEDYLMGTKCLLDAIEEQYPEGKQIFMFVVTSLISEIDDLFIADPVELIGESESGQSVSINSKLLEMLADKTNFSNKKDEENEGN